MKNIFKILRAELSYSKAMIIASLIIIPLGIIPDVFNIKNELIQSLRNINQAMSFGIIFSWIQVYSREKRHLINNLLPATKLQVITARILILFLWTGLVSGGNLIFRSITGTMTESDAVVFMVSSIIFPYFFGGLNLFNDLPGMMNDRLPERKLIVTIVLLVLIAVITVGIVLITMWLISGELFIIMTLLSIFMNLGSIYTFTRRNNYLAE